MRKVVYRYAYDNLPVLFLLIPNDSRVFDGFPTILNHSPSDCKKTAMRSDRHFSRSRHSQTDKLSVSRFKYLARYARSAKNASNYFWKDGYRETTAKWEVVHTKMSACMFWVIPPRDGNGLTMVKPFRFNVCVILFERRPIGTHT